MKIILFRSNQSSFNDKLTITSFISPDESILEITWCKCMIFLNKLSHQSGLTLALLNHLLPMQALMTFQHGGDAETLVASVIHIPGHE